MCPHQSAQCHATILQGCYVFRSQDRLSSFQYLQVRCAFTIPVLLVSLHATFITYPGEGSLCHLETCCTTLRLWHGTAIGRPHSELHCHTVYILWAVLSNVLPWCSDSWKPLPYLALPAPCGCFYFRTCSRAMFMTHQQPCRAGSQHSLIHILCPTMDPPIYAHNCDCNEFTTRIQIGLDDSGQVGLQSSSSMHSRSSPRRPQTVDR